jgi:hypothetical protein
MTVGTDSILVVYYLSYSVVTKRMQSQRKLQFGHARMSKVSPTIGTDGLRSQSRLRNAMRGSGANDARAMSYTLGFMGLPLIKAGEQPALALRWSC